MRTRGGHIAEDLADVVWADAAAHERRTEIPVADHPRGVAVGPGVPAHGGECRELRRHLRARVNDAHRDRGEDALCATDPIGITVVLSCAREASPEVAWNIKDAPFGAPPSDRARVSEKVRTGRAHRVRLRLPAIGVGPGAPHAEAIRAPWTQEEEITVLRIRTKVAIDVAHLVPSPESIRPTRREATLVIQVNERWCRGETVECRSEYIGPAECGEHPVINLNVERVGEVLAHLLCGAR